ncbi:MAG: carbohydrate kinase family protein [Anaerolineales bacterium]|nr:carbohydrate kinase family protein [Anaerolineales bacterium]
MNIVLTGSVAFDYLMTFPGYFKDHFLADKLDRISLSFLVDSLVRRPGGIAANIAYTLALLGEKPKVMATVGEDFEEQRAWLESHGVDTSAIRTIPDAFTASFFVNTDLSNAQIASFHTGAMAYSAQLSFSDLKDKPDLAVISPNDPKAMLKYTRECDRLGIAYIYDPSQQLVRLDASDIRAGIETSRALFSNEYEFGLIEEKTGMDLRTILRYAEFVVVTLGEDGTKIHTTDAEIHVPSVSPKLIADPTGVGDSFRGGFLKGYLHGLRLELCGQMGSLAATYCLESDGPQGHYYELASFIQRFREHFDDENELDRLL